MSHLIPEGMRTGCSPPGSSQASLAGTHLHSWKLSAEEHVLFSAPCGMRWSWPGCMDKAKGARRDHDDQRCLLCSPKSSPWLVKQRVQLGS